MCFLCLRVYVCAHVDERVGHTELPVPRSNVQPGAAEFIDDVVHTRCVSGIAELEEGRRTLKVGEPHHGAGQSGAGQ